MRKYTLGVVAILLAGSASMFVPTLRGEMLNACEAPPLIDPLVQFIRPGNRSMTARVQDGLCKPKLLLECSLGFIVREPGGRLWALAAGHCYGDVTETETPRVYAYHPEFGAWGRVMFSVGDAQFGIVQEDIALIRIFDHYQDNVDPSVPVFGGPQGMVQPGDLAPEEGRIAHFGTPAVPVSPIGLPRVGVLNGWNAEWFECTCATQGGDSGSPAIELTTGGRAVGMHFGHPVEGATGIPQLDSEASTTSIGPLLHTQLALLADHDPAYGLLTLVDADLTPFGQALVDGAP